MYQRSKRAVARRAMGKVLAGCVVLNLVSCAGHQPVTQAPSTVIETPETLLSTASADSVINLPRTEPPSIELPALLPIPLSRAESTPVPPERAAEAVASVMRTHSASILPCSFVLRDQPDLNGVVVLAVEVIPDGRVAGAEILENTTGNRELARCLADAAGIWQFKPVDEEYPRSVIVRLPFRMK
ncbi:MAG: AgmX/PglI C-terminal domain-containing protein [Candidatus Latescibacteria bacterium]|nr:AgmX/PglI C-terminal domain-containing protein [Candidatus Latescibacterota bacterium]